MNRFDGRTAIITGGWGDIESCIALKLGLEGTRILLVEKNKDRDTSCIEHLTQNSIDTELVSGDVRDEQTAEQKIVDYMRSKIPMERFGEVHETANMVTWLLSEQCSFTTGAVFDVSGRRATY